MRMAMRVLMRVGVAVVAVATWLNLPQLAAPALL